MVSKAVEKATVGLPDRPMNQTQLKNLQKLVDADFADLQAQVSNYIHKQANTRRQQIVAKYDQEAATAKAIEIINAAVAKLQTEIAKVQPKLKALGFEENYHVINVQHSIRHLNFTKAQDEIVQLNESTHRLAQAAANHIAKHHRAIARVILLQGITGEGASEILSDMPTFEEVLESVKEELADYADDLAVLS